MKHLENYGVQALSTKELKSTDGGWRSGGSMGSANWSGVVDSFIDAGQWVLGLFAGVADGITDGLND